MVCYFVFVFTPLRCLSFVFFWELLETPWELCGAFGGFLGVPWGLLRGSWVLLRSSWRFLWGLLWLLGVPWGLLWLLGAPWGRKFLNLTSGVLLQEKLEEVKKWQFRIRNGIGKSSLDQQFPKSYFWKISANKYRRSQEMAVQD